MSQGGWARTEEMDILFEVIGVTYNYAFELVLKNVLEDMEVRRKEKSEEQIRWPQVASVW